MKRKTITQTLYFSTKEVKLIHSVFGVRIEMDDAPSNAQPGEPEFPSKTIRIGLPDGYEASRIYTKVLRSEPLTQSPIFVAPAREKGIAPKEFEIQGAPLGNWIKPQKLAYERIIKQLNRSVAKLVDNKPEGRKMVAEAEVFPVRYDDNGALELLTELRLTITLNPIKKVHPRLLFAKNRLAWTERKHAIASHKVINPEVFETLNRRKTREIYNTETNNVPESDQPFLTSGTEEPPTPNNNAPYSGGGNPVTGSTPVSVPNEVDYLIITDQNSWDADSITATGSLGDLPATFQRLANWKKSRGLRTHIATVTNIVGGSYGDFKTGARDLQEVIRNFLKYFVWRYSTDWVLLGGDVGILPTRLICGSVQWGCHRFEEAEKQEASGDTELPQGKVVWKGTFLGMRVDKGLIGDKNNHTLTMLENGTIIPYNSGGPSGTVSPRWYHTTDETFSTFSAAQTEYIRVDGNASLINGKVQWYTPKNLMPADFYYSSLYAPTYNIPGKHDWDKTGNGLYGQWNETTNLDGVDYQVDVGVGRAPVQSVAEVDIFIDKIMDYEKASERPADYARFKRMLYVGEHWHRKFRRIGRHGGDPTPPNNNKYSYSSANSRTIIQADVLEKGLNIELISYISETNYNIIPYNKDASPANRGWYYAKSETDLSASFIHYSFWFFDFYIPVPTRWIVIYSGDTAELTPIHFVIDSNELDGAIKEQEELRDLMKGWFPRIDNVRRLYTDEPDLPLTGLYAASVKHLTDDTLKEELNHGPHFVSLSGHGNWGGCCHFNNGTVSALTNGNKSFIVFADSCTTSAFDNEDAISEKSVIKADKGAVAYIGYSRYGWIGVGPYFRKEFFKARSNGIRHLAQLNDTRFNADVNKQWMRWHVVEQNLIGCPEMPVWKDDMDVRMAYVANKNTGELHERNCQWVERMAVRNQLFLETKWQGLNAGYDGCYYCLREHHTK
ncbi:MAG: C25 family cysteine peptidase [Bacteroidota bacterium]